MFWRTPIDPLFSSGPDQLAADAARGIGAFLKFVNPLWPARAPATPASAGARGDQNAARDPAGVDYA